jgi:hypothetical protein
MSKQPSTLGDPHEDGDLAAAPDPDLADQPLAVRSARKEGRLVVRMLCFERESECVVECDVYPVSDLRVNPLQPGPYRFPTPADARLFMDEAAQSLAYLGCDVV